MYCSSLNGTGVMFDVLRMKIEMCGVTGPSGIPPAALEWISAEAATMRMVLKLCVAAANRTAMRAVRWKPVVDTFTPAT